MLSGEYQAPRMKVLDLKLDAGLCQSAGAGIDLPNSSGNLGWESFETDEEFTW